jgi:hypothetical protein
MLRAFWSFASNPERSATMFKLTRLVLIALFIAPLCVPASSSADEISEQIQRGLELYEKGNLSEALEELNFAVAQMRQKKADNLGELFPEALSGWKAGQPETKSGGAGMLGGGISASQTYEHTGGKGRATIEIMTDSPLIQSMAAMLSNPIFLQGGKNGRLIRINGEKAVLKDKGKRGEVMMLLDNKILIKVEVRRMDAAGDAAKQFAEKINLDKVRELAG